MANNPRLIINPKKIKPKSYGFGTETGTTQQQSTPEEKDQARKLLEFAGTNTFQNALKIGVDIPSDVRQIAQKTVS